MRECNNCFRMNDNLRDICIHCGHHIGHEPSTVVDDDSSDINSLITDEFGITAATELFEAVAATSMDYDSNPSFNGFDGGNSGGAGASSDF